MLRDAFSGGGRSVPHVNVKRNATSGKPRGFAFVDMGSAAEAEAAIAALNGTVLDGKQIKVGAAKELHTGPSYDYGSSGGYGGGRGRGGRGGGRW
jgi:RNA recognition motif-containing protein